MPDVFYAKGKGNNGYIKNLEVCSFNNLDGNCGMFQMALYKTEGGKYYYWCLFWGDSVVMISDDYRSYSNLLTCGLIELDLSHHHFSKIQIADDLMIVAMMQERSDALVDHQN